MAKLQLKKDEFNGTTLQTGTWTQFTAGSATMSYDATGATMTFPATTSSATDGDITTATTGTLIDSYALVNILAFQLAAATTCTFFFRLQITSANVVGWRITSGNLIAYKIVASASTDLFTVAMSLVTHAWLRIQENNGTTFWETSYDGTAWTTRWSETNPITETALTVLLGGIATGIDSSPGSCKWRSFNIKPTGVKFNNRGLRPHSFSPGLAR